VGGAPPGEAKTDQARHLPGLSIGRGLLAAIGAVILRFSAVPDSLEVHVSDRLGQPFLGTGEAAQGPAAAAIGNAFADASGARVRELPITAERVKAIGA
jgi:hypothetical protein